MGTFASIETGEPDLISKGQDPTDIFFSFRKQNTSPVPDDQFETVIPFVIYRYQLPSDLYPDAQPNLLQVSPLIDRISYGYQGGSLRLKDPFFRLVAFNDDTPLIQVPVDGTFNRTNREAYTVDQASKYPNIPYLKGMNSLVWWIDPMPVAEGAKYQYLIVHFTKRGEIDRIIPTNPVQH
jgi:hypothetical protein